MNHQRRDYKLRYKGGGAKLYRPKQPPKEVPIWPDKVLARRPDKGTTTRIVRAYPHSPKRKAMLKNPYGINKEPEQVSQTLERLKKAGVARRKDLQQTAKLAETRRGTKPEQGESKLIKTIKGSQIITHQNTSRSPAMSRSFKASTNPHNMYLLTNYLAFDKIDEHERSEIMEDLIDKWLSETYELDKGSDALWHYVRTYCESSCMLDRITTHKNSPNPLSAAACCEILDALSRKELRYGRIFRLIKGGIYDAIYVDGSSKKPYFHRKTWFTRAQAAEKALRHTRVRNIEADLKEDSSSPKKGINNGLGKYLPDELAREIYTMGPEYTTTVLQNLTQMQRNGFEQQYQPNVSAIPATNLDQPENMELHAQSSFDGDSFFSNASFGNEHL